MMKNKSPSEEVSVNDAGDSGGEMLPMAAEMKPNALGAPRMALLGRSAAGQPRLGATFIEPEAFADPSPAVGTFDDDTEDSFGEEEEEFEEEDEEEDEFDDEEDDDDEFDDEDDEDDEFDDEEDDDDEDEEEDDEFDDD